MRMQNAQRLPLRVRKFLCEEGRLFPGEGTFLLFQGKLPLKEAIWVPGAESFHSYRGKMPLSQGTMLLLHGMLELKKETFLFGTGILPL